MRWNASLITLREQQFEKELALFSVMGKDLAARK
jgi:hypothetical protein